MKRFSWVALFVLSFCVVSCGGGGGDGEVRILTLPDTGQTDSYTDTFGEDHDYTINAPSYTENGDSTVTDNVTGLMWQQEDASMAMTWGGALSYCEGLQLAGHDDWRLPTKKELMSIVNYGTYSPAIDPEYFPETEPSGYWSSTTSAYGASYAWYVSFGNGYVYYGDKPYGGDVRCVR